MVPIEKLDNLIKSTDVDAIKIDVEGAELGVLRGAVDILRNVPSNHHV
jgi:FkbM family methyltransferase